jgi:hypothetical protein
MRQLVNRCEMDTSFFDKTVGLVEVVGFAIDFSEDQF